MKTISQKQLLTGWYLYGTYEETKDGNHRCAWCNKKLRTNQYVIEYAHPSYKGYRRTDISYWHKDCNNPFEYRVHEF